MKIAISSTGPDFDAQVDRRFGRCDYFLIVELDDMSFEALDNTSAALEGGAGIQSAKLVIDKGARAVVTGSVGPNAAKILSEAGLNMVTGASGTVRDLARQYKEGKVRSGAAQEPPAPQAPTFPSGMGAGWGMGRGMGRRRGGGFAAGPPGFCMCPRCGYRVPHHRGTPCFEHRCARCGTAMRHETAIR